VVPRWQSKAEGSHAYAADKTAHPALTALAVAALGVVFGDIGTSPLYTFKKTVPNVTDGQGRGDDSRCRIVSHLDA